MLSAAPTPFPIPQRILCPSRAQTYRRMAQCRLATQVSASALWAASPVQQQTSVQASQAEPQAGLCRFDMGTGGFTAAAQLRWHRALVLAMQHVHIALPAQPQQQEHGARSSGSPSRHVLAVTGGSDGSLAVWDLSAVAPPGLDGPRPSSEASEAVLRGDPPSQEAAQGLGGSCRQAGVGIEPLLTQRSWHPGAFHALSICAAGELESCGQVMHWFSWLLSWHSLG